MNWQAIFETIWAAMNSAVGITCIAGVALWLLSKLYAKKPDWKKYEGTIIAAVKNAEKLIPDDTPNKAAKRLDEALKYVLAVHHEIENRTATTAELANLREGIQIVHAELESKDSLQKMTTAVKTALILFMVGVLAVGGCTVVTVPPGAGPVNVGASNALVVTDGQDTDNQQTPVSGGEKESDADAQPAD
ncbi:MAG: hypothetical protein PHW08_15000 [Kiritimatiellae bacterium]|nr:hypothetical protein [Kiritimatiellia bacterium]